MTIDKKKEGNRLVLAVSGRLDTMTAPELESVIKDNMFPIPPLFRMIKNESGTEWKEMYKVFNMGHRMEIYTDNATAQGIIDIARSFNIDARIIGHVEEAPAAQVTVATENGTFVYNN